MMGSKAQPRSTKGAFLRGIFNRENIQTRNQIQEVFFRVKSFSRLQIRSRTHTAVPGFTCETMPAKRLSVNNMSRGTEAFSMLKPVLLTERPDSRRFLEAQSMPPAEKIPPE
jgi:hypothetical protein